MDPSIQKALPYVDDKPVGAADFYFAINATFRFILKQFGMDGLKKYWSDLATSYFAPVTHAWKIHGLKGVAAYEEAFFRAESGSQVEVVSEADRVTVHVKVCPAISHL